MGSALQIRGGAAAQPSSGPQPQPHCLPPLPSTHAHPPPPRCKVLLISAPLRSRPIASRRGVCFLRSMGRCLRLRSRCLPPHQPRRQAGLGSSCAVQRLVAAPVSRRRGLGRRRGFGGRPDGSSGVAAGSPRAQHEAPAQGREATRAFERGRREVSPRRAVDAAALPRLAGKEHVGLLRTRSVEHLAVEDLGAAPRHGAPPLPKQTPPPHASACTCTRCEMGGRDSGRQNSAPSRPLDAAPPQKRGLASAGRA